MPIIRYPLGQALWSRTFGPSPLVLAITLVLAVWIGAGY